MLGLLIWVGCALGVTLALYALLALGRLGAWLLSPNLNRRMARNRVRYSRRHPQIKDRPLSLPGRNGSRPRAPLGPHARSWPRLPSSRV